MQVDAPDAFYPCLCVLAIPVYKSPPLLRLVEFILYYDVNQSPHFKLNLASQKTRMVRLSDGEDRMILV